MSKKITLYEFKLLPEQEQYHITFPEGEFLDSRICGDQRFALYAVDKFFVEVEYDADENKIINRRPFKTGKLLDKYSSLQL